MDTGRVVLSGDAYESYPREGEQELLLHELAHRSHPSESFVTNISRSGPDSFLLRAILPTNHPFFRLDDQGRHDPMLIAETMRQAGIVVGHVGFDVPLGTQFVMADMGFQILDPTRLTAAGAPVEIELAICCTEVVRKLGELRQTRFQVSISRRTQPAGPLAGGSGFLRCLPGPMYERLRSRHARTAGSGIDPEPTRSVLPPALVGRRHPRDVLLADPRGCLCGPRSAIWSVQVDASHPGLFDHPLDHMPGMVQLEALRQAAVALTHTIGGHGTFAGCEVRFLRMIDVSDPVSCHARILDGRTVAVALVQGDLPPFTEGTIAIDQHPQVISGRGEVGWTTAQA